MAMNYANAITVNQKLAFARTLIQHAEAAYNDGSIPAQQSLHAFLDGACSQLLDALTHLLLEIASEQLLAQQAADTSLLDLLQQFAVANEHNALVQELNDLRSRPSWLRDLLSAKHNPSTLATLIGIEINNQVSSEESAKNNSALLATDKSSSKGPIASLRYWLINIQSLVERHRNQAVEE